MYVIVLLYTPFTPQSVAWVMRSRFVTLPHTHIRRKCMHGRFELWVRDKRNANMILWALRVHDVIQYCVLWKKKAPILLYLIIFWYIIINYTKQSTLEMCSLTTTAFMVFESTYHIIYYIKYHMYIIIILYSINIVSRVNFHWWSVTPDCFGDRIYIHSKITKVLSLRIKRTAQHEI